MWDDPETTAFFAKFVTIHSKVLKEYKRNLMSLAHTEGQAPTRALLVEFPDDAEARKIQDQFMLGEDLMMAPVFKNRQRKRNAYFPKGSWTHYFTKQRYDFPNGGQLVKDMQAPIGTPLVFVKTDSPLMSSIIEYEVEILE